MLLLVLISLLCLWILWRVFQTVITNDLKPPGPWGFPILGHLPLLGAAPYIKLLEWKKTYGPIISVKFGSIPAVVLMDTSIIKEAFSQYAMSDRPRTEHAYKVSSGKGFIYGRANYAVEQRQFVIRNLKDWGLGTKTMEQLILDEVKIFVDDLEAEVKSMFWADTRPIVITDRFKADVLNSFCNIFLSRRFQKEDDQYKKLIHFAHDAITSPGVLGEMASFIPWLGNLVSDYSGLTKNIEGYHKIYEFAQQEIDRHELTRVSGQPRDFTDAYLDKVEATTDVNSSFHKSQNYQSIVTGDIFFGALDTTSVALEFLVIHLVRNPDIQSRLYDEVSRVTSNSRSPLISDRPQMPLVDAVSKELLRASTIGPFGGMHWTMEDVTLRGYVIPKDTMVIANYYGLHQDDSLFDDPESFRPDRFLEIDEEGLMKVKPKVEGYLPFGHGKRMCVGRVQAMDTIFAYTANLTQKFKFEPWQGIPPSPDMNPGFVCTPKYKIFVKVTLRDSSNSS